MPEDLTADRRRKDAPIPITMTPNQIKRLLPNASQDFIRANCHSHTGAASELESDSSHGALAKGEVQEGGTGRLLIRVASIRKRLLDEDNICEKYHVDCCRYAGLIPGDDPAKAKIEVPQRKTKKGEEEVVEITIEEIK